MRGENAGAGVERFLSFTHLFAVVETIFRVLLDAARIVHHINYSCWFLNYSWLVELAVGSCGEAWRGWSVKCESGYLK